MTTSKGKGRIKRPITVLRGPKRPRRDEERENRITMDIIVDAYGPEEHAMGWY